jgi:hypothetical protein
MKAQILQAISENKKIKIGSLVFTSFYNNSTKEMNYYMNSDYKIEKWSDYKTEKEYIKAIMQRVNYITKKGFTNVIEIN